MADYRHQKDISNYLTFVSSKPPGGKLFNNFLLLTFVYREPLSQKRKFQFQFHLKMASLHSESPICAPPRLSAVSQGCPRNSANICLVEYRSFSTVEDGMSAASFLHSSFIQAISAVMLWPVHVQKVHQASEHLCPAKLQTRCDICCACLEREN